MAFFLSNEAKPTQFNFNVYNSEQFQMFEALFLGLFEIIALLPVKGQ